MNRPASHPIHTRLPLGLAAQELIKPMIEKHIGETLTMSSYAFDTLDAESDSYLIEIKMRQKKYHWSDSRMVKEGVLIPAVKIFRAADEKKTVRFYYYYESDESLWYWDFNQRDINQSECKIPFFHRDQQPHYYIKQRFWSSV